jgi:dipeptidyl aminopeptidase/acylaminoacyl peptidase
MYQFFPGNYMWSQAVLRLLFTGGSIGEALQAAAELQQAAGENDHQQWLVTWSALGERLWEQAERELGADHPRSARESFFRASAYLGWAISFVSHRDPRRREGHQRSLEAFGRFAALSEPPIERVEVPFGEASLPAWFVPGAGQETRKPTACFVPGLDSTKEQGMSFAAVLAERGFNVLLVDGPGVGEAVLFRGLINRPDEEAAGSADFDYLAGRPDVDASRIALVGLSLGGYRVSRMAAFESRFAGCVAWGAIWDWSEIWEQRLLPAQGPASTTHEHMFHVLGARTLEEVTEKWKPWRLEGIAQRIRCPMLILHGERDAQVPKEQAYALYEASGSAKKELKLFTEEEGGSAHCQNDNRLLAHAYIADWLEDVLVRGRERQGLFVGTEQRS